MKTDSGWLAPSEAARRADVSKEWIRRLCLDGAIEYTDSPLGRLIDTASLDEWIRARAIRREAVPA